MTRMVCYAGGMKHLTTLILACTLGLASVQAAEKAIFDGKTFAGWEGDTNKTFRIRDGAIVGGNLQSKIPQNEFLCTTRSYTNFILTLKFKLLGEGANAGVQIRTKRIPNHHEVIGYQADMGDPAWWGCLYDESRRNKVLVAADSIQIKRLLRPNDWNDYEIQTEGKRIRILLNGEQTIAYTEEDPAIPQAGLIAFQIHGGGKAEVHYKDIVLKEL